MRCSVCDGASETLFRKLILGRHDVGYHRCLTCGFVQTDPPHWLDESYAAAINDRDIGPVSRAIRGTRLVEAVIFAGFDPKAAFVDWGGGYGLFVRMMRDLGYDFHWSDPHCQNLFAKQLVAQPGQTFELLTAFEVFEHLPDPIAGLDAMIERSRSILFTTMVPPIDVGALSDWWYLAPEHGQHVSLYSLASLRVLAERYGLVLSTDRHDVHLLSGERISERLFRLLAADGKAAWLWRRARVRRSRPPSRLLSDFRAITGWRI